MFAPSFPISENLLNVFKGTVNLIKNPSQTDSVYDIEDGLQNSSIMKISLNYIKRHPENVEIIAERYIAPSPDLNQLLTYPKNSLGYQYAFHLKQAGFDPNFYRPIAITNEASYVLFRFRQTHDIWHLVTGFDTNVIGELGLKAFEIAQTRRPLAFVLLVGGLFKGLIHFPRSLNLLLQQIIRGYRLGNHCQPFLAQKWEENWKKPLTEWQEKLRVTSFQE